MMETIHLALVAEIGLGDGQFKFCLAQTWISTDHDGATILQVIPRHTAICFRWSPTRDNLESWRLPWAHIQRRLLQASVQTRTMRLERVVKRTCFKVQRLRPHAKHQNPASFIEMVRPVLRNSCTSGSFAPNPDDDCPQVCLLKDGSLRSGSRSSQDSL